MLAIKVCAAVVEKRRMQISPLGSAPTANVITPTASKTEIIAHRGFHGRDGVYENTVDAYLRAMRLGVDLMETDIRRTADGVLVLFHDASLGSALISRTKYADLPRLPNGRLVSTLQGLVDAMAGAGGATRLLVETKEHGYEAEILATLYSRLSPSQFELMSFNQDSVRAMRQLAPDAKVGVLFGLLPDWKNGTWPISGAAIVAQARELGVDFVAIDRMIANDARLDAIAAAGFFVAVWTVDKPGDLARLLKDSRVQRIITDAPDTAMAMRDAARKLQPALAAARVT